MKQTWKFSEEELMHVQVSPSIPSCSPIILASLIEKIGPLFLLSSLESPPYKDATNFVFPPSISIRL
jgi:hypothetical protein